MSLSIVRVNLQGLPVVNHGLGTLSVLKFTISLLHSLLLAGGRVSITGLQKRRHGQKEEQQ